MTESFLHSLDLHHKPENKNWVGIRFSNAT